MDFKSYLIKHHLSDPFAPIRRQIVPEEKEHKGTDKNYQTRGIPVQHWEWVSLDKSRQWQALLDTVKILRGRGNQALVMVGTINPGLLDPSTLNGLRKLRQQAAADLKQKGIEPIMLPEVSIVENLQIAIDAEYETKALTRDSINKGDIESSESTKATNSPVACSNPVFLAPLKPLLF